MDDCTCSSRESSGLVIFWCNDCHRRHKFSPPRLTNEDNSEDFSERNICVLSGRFFHGFKNIRSEIYLRTKSGSRTWYFQGTPTCQLYKLCDHCGSDLERVFERLIPQTANEEQEQNYAKYEQQRDPHDSSDSMDCTETDFSQPGPVIQTPIPLVSDSLQGSTAINTNSLSSDDQKDLTDDGMDYSDDATNDRAMEDMSIDSSMPSSVPGVSDFPEHDRNTHTSLPCGQQKQKRSVKGYDCSESFSTQDTIKHGESEGNVKPFSPAGPENETVSLKSQPACHGFSQSPKVSENLQHVENGTDFPHSENARKDQFLLTTRTKSLEALTSQPTCPNRLGANSENLKHAENGVWSMENGVSSMRYLKTCQKPNPCTSYPGNCPCVSHQPDSLTSSAGVLQNKGVKSLSDPNQLSSTKDIISRDRNVTVINLTSTLDLDSEADSVKSQNESTNAFSSLPVVARSEPNSAESQNTLHNLNQSHLCPENICEDKNFGNTNLSPPDSLQDSVKMQTGMSNPTWPSISAENISGINTSEGTKGTSGQIETARNVRGPPLEQTVVEHHFQGALSKSESCNNPEGVNTQLADVDIITPSPDLSQPCATIDVIHLNPDRLDPSPEDDCIEASEETMKNVEDWAGFWPASYSDPRENGFSKKTIQASTKESLLKNQIVMLNNMKQSDGKKFLSASVGWFKNKMDLSSMKLFARLQAKFQELFKNDNWRSKFPVNFAFERIFEFKFNFDTMVREGNYVKTENTIFSGKSSQDEILILGAPGFGKTTFCKMMSFQWASGVKEMKDFKLCIYCLLPELIRGPDLSHEIVSLCYHILGDNTVSLTEIHTALEKNSEKTILLLDGLDQTTDYQKGQVLNFVRSRPVFCKSTLLVTSGPSTEPSLLGNFKRNVILKGFSLRYLNKYLRSMGVPVKLEDEMFNHLSELSPFFVAWSAKAIRANYKDIRLFGTAYSLLELLMQELITNHSKTTDYKSLQLELGRKCFEKLVEGTMYFEEKELRFPFCEPLKLLEKCNILHQINVRNENRIWKISSKVLQVFFATAYLRHMWNACEDKMKFLTEDFCCNACSGDYVIEDATHVYYVGLIPEIVLKYDFELSLTRANFEMFYDVEERIENSQAFDSVNLLQRIKSSHLKRFGFQLVNSPDDDNDGHFNFLNNLLCSKNLENFIVDYDIYKNKYEEKVFLKMEICDNENAFFGVLRETRSLKLDRLYIEFSFLKLAELFPFINTIFCLYFSGLNLYDNLVYQPFEEFLFNLVLIFLQCTTIQAVTVSCTDDVDSAQTITFHVSEPDTKTSFSKASERRVSFSSKKFCSLSGPSKEMNNFCEVCFSEREYFIYKSILYDYLVALKNDSQNPRISVNIW